MKKLYFSATILCAATIIGISMMSRKVNAQAPHLQGFTISEIRFDESMGGKKATPVIPKDWKFVAVSSGEKVNSNTLWFQDAAGNIYMLQGFTSYRKFTISEQVQKLAAQ